MQTRPKKTPGFVPVYVSAYMADHKNITAHTFSRHTVRRSLRHHDTKETNNIFTRQDVSHVAFILHYGDVSVPRFVC